MGGKEMKLFKKGLAGILAFSMLISCVSVMNFSVAYAYGEVATEYYDIDFERGYTVNENWMTSIDGGGQIELQNKPWVISMPYGKVYTVDNDDYKNTFIGVVADPTNSGKGNVLKFEPSKTQPTPNLITRLNQDIKGVDIAEGTTYISQKLYIDSTNVSSIATDGNWYYALADLMKGNVPWYKGTHQSHGVYSSGYWKITGYDSAKKELNLDGHAKIPVDTWVEMEFIITNTDGTKTVDCYIDGEKKSTINTTETSIAGPVFNLLGRISAGDSTDPKPVMYMDDFKAAVLTDTVCTSRDVRAEGDADGGSFDITFNNKLNPDTFSKNMFSIEGVNGGIESATLGADNKTVTFTYGNVVLDPNSEYTLKGSGLKDYYNQTVSDFTLNFTTNDFTKFVPPAMTVTEFTNTATLDTLTATAVFSNPIVASDVDKNSVKVVGVNDAVISVTATDDYSIEIVFDKSVLDPNQSYTVTFPGIVDEWSQAPADEKTYRTTDYEKYIYKEGFETYDKNVNWVTGDKTSNPPLGWVIQGQNFEGYKADNTVMVVDDPEGGDNKVLKIAPSITGSSVAVRKQFVSADGQKTVASVAHDKSKFLYIKNRFYIDKSTSPYYYTGNAWYDTIFSVANTASCPGGHEAFSKLTRLGATTSTENDMAFNATAQNGIVNAKGQSVNLPLGRWFDIEYIIDTTAVEVLNYDVWIDGEKANSSTLIGCRRYNEKKELQGIDDYFYGVAFSPTGYLKANPNPQSPVMYVDDMYAAYVTAYAPEKCVLRGEEKLEDMSKVKPDDTILIGFEEQLSYGTLDKLNNSIANLKVKDSKGNDVTASCNVFTSLDDIRISMTDGFCYDETYTIELPELPVFNKYKQQFKNVKVEFTTIKAEGAYVDNTAIQTSDNTPINEASNIELKLTVLDREPGVTAVAVFYDENNCVKEIVKQDVSSLTTTINYPGNAQYIKYFLVDENGNPIQNEMTYNPLNADIPETKIDTTVNTLTSSLTDMEKGILTVRGKSKITGSNNYGYVAVYDITPPEPSPVSLFDIDDEESPSLYVTTPTLDIDNAVAFSFATIDADGYMAASVTLPQQTGNYEIRFVNAGEVETATFDYVSVSDIANMLRKISKSDINDPEYVPMNNIYSTIIALNDGIGLDESGLFSTDRAKNLLSYRVDKKRDTLAAATATDMGIINAFRTIVNEVTAEDAFLTKLENPNQKEEIEYILKNNVAITGFDPASYANVTSSVYYAFVGKTFANADEVKTFFETTLRNTPPSGTPTVPSSPGGDDSPSRGGGSSGGVITNKPTTDVGGYIDLVGYGWAKDAITDLTNKKIISGMGDGIYAPSQNVTREQFAKMIVVAMGVYDENSTCEFGDIQPGDWAYPYVASAYKNGIIEGIDDGVFGTGHSIRRQDVAVMIYNALGKPSVSKKAESEEDAGFADSADVSDYAVDAVEYLRSSGIMVGDDDNKFGPKDLLTRAEAAVVVHRFFNLDK